MKDRFKKQIGMVALVVMGLICLVSPVLALDGQWFSGDYNLVGQDATFWNSGGTTTTDVYGNSGNITFNLDGTCRVVYSGSDYEAGFTNPSAVDVWPDSGDMACTYAVADGGALQIAFPDGSLEDFWLSADGNAIIAGGAELRTDEGGRQGYTVGQMLAIKTGTSLSAASLKGTFHMVSQDIGFWRSGDWIAADNYGNKGTLIFNGAGGCSVNYTGSDYEVSLSNPDAVTICPDSGTSACTYTVASNGDATITFPDNSTETFWVSGDGNRIVAGGAKTETFSDGVSHKTGQMLAVKRGTTMTKASLQGVFQMVGQDLDFLNDFNTLYSEIYANNVTMSFNGAGNCSTSYEGTGYAVPLSSPGSVNASSDPGSSICSYTVAANGATTITFPDGSVSFMLAADGNALLYGSANVKKETNKTTYRVEQFVGIKTNPYIGIAESPLDISVPAIDPDGSYTVSWSPSAPVGAIYVLEESTDPGFPATTATRVAYKGTATSAPITLRVAGRSYYYRVMATKAAYASSEWTTAVAPCNVGRPVAPLTLTVPQMDADGSFSVSWSASSTPGVTYVLEEATNDATFSPDNTRVVDSTTGLSLNPVAAAGGVATYYYRVRAIKDGFADSLLRVAANPCKVGTPAAPALITVPTVSATGTYKVSWDVSASAGVTYTLEEATNETFTSGKRTAYTGTLTSASISARVKGQIYYYRVRTNKVGWASSDWTVGGNNCKIATPVAPAGITVPATDADGSYNITWLASPTPGVTYELFEATVANFSDEVSLYSGTERIFEVMGKKAGLVYYYRVKAQKTDFPDSLWKTGTVGCKVGILSAPANLAVPESDDDGSYSLSWNPSPTEGVSYEVQEATNSTFAAGLRTLPAGTATSWDIAGRAFNVTYYYRVRSIKTGFVASAWVPAANGVKNVGFTVAELIGKTLFEVYQDDINGDGTPDTWAGATLKFSTATTGVGDDTKMTLTPTAFPFSYSVTGGILAMNFGGYGYAYLKKFATGTTRHDICWRDTLEEAKACVAADEYLYVNISLAQGAISSLNGE